MGLHKCQAWVWLGCEPVGMGHRVYEDFGGFEMTNGYPDDDDLAMIGTLLTTNDFEAGAKTLCDFLLETGYARCTWLGDPDHITGLEVATGGWSGCEEILAATHGTLWRALYWESTHKGGMERFMKDVK